MKISWEEITNSYLFSYVKLLLEVILIIFVTQTVFFIVLSYCVSGDAFLALRNFYYMTYNIGWYNV